MKHLVDESFARGVFVRAIEVGRCADVYVALSVGEDVQITHDGRLLIGEECTR